MPIRVTITGVLDEDVWGAEEVYDDYGKVAVIEMILECLHDFADDAKWTVTRVRERKEERDAQ